MALVTQHVMHTWKKDEVNTALALEGGITVLAIEGDIRNCTNHRRRRHINYLARLISDATQLIY